MKVGGGRLVVETTTPPFIRPRRCVVAHWGIESGLLSMLFSVPTDSKLPAAELSGSMALRG
jgi:hypothetical protein